MINGTDQADHDRASVKDQQPVAAAEPVRADPRALIPPSFSNLTVDSKTILSEINSKNIYDHVIDMITNDVSYVLEGPIIVGKDILFIVKSEVNANVSYRVKISPKGPLSKRKIEQYKNFTYKCECPAKRLV